MLENTDCTSFEKKLALISDIVEKLNEKGIIFGKTVLMKLLFLSKAVKEIPLDYKFTLYTYGPFDSEVMQDLNFLNQEDILDVKYIHDQYGYSIKPDEKIDLYREKADSFLSKYSQETDDLVEEFGEFSAKDLELKSTIILIEREYKEVSELKRNDLVKIVKDIKPYFNDDRIEREVDWLVNGKYIAAS